MFESLLVTKNLKKRPPMLYGLPDRRSLREWIYEINLGRYDFLLKDPLDVLNFISYHAKYQSDLKTHGVGEYWPRNAREVEKWIFEKKTEDCDGVAIAIASILHTLGNRDIRLALGHYGKEPNEKGEFVINHAYCLLMRRDKPNDPYLLEGIGDDILSEMMRLNDKPSYHTLISASAFSKRVWIHGQWIEKYGRMK